MAVILEEVEDEDYSIDSSLRKESTRRRFNETKDINFNALQVRNHQEEIVQHGTSLIYFCITSYEFFFSDVSILKITKIQKYSFHGISTVIFPSRASQ
jgi:hypothetical protein